MDKTLVRTAKETRFVHVLLTESFRKVQFSWLRNGPLVFNSASTHAEKKSFCWEKKENMSTNQHHQLSISSAEAEANFNFENRERETNVRNKSRRRRKVMTAHQKMFQLLNLMRVIKSWMKRERECREVEKWVKQKRNRLRVKRANQGDNRENGRKNWQTVLWK